MTLKGVLAATLTLSTTTAALADPVRILSLGNAPLVGQVASTPELQRDMSQYSAQFQRAGVLLGLTPQEYAQFLERVRTKQLTYVALPRHIDAMSWAANGDVHIVRDVIVPANTMGWEVDLRERNSVLAVLVPARCGNLSVVRRPLPLLAKAQPHKRRISAPARIAAAPPALAAAPAPPAPPATAQLAPPMLGVPAAPAPAPPAVAALSSPPAPPEHHTRLWPLLFLPLIGAVMSHGTTGGGIVTSNSPGPTSMRPVILPPGQVAVPPVITPPGSGGPTPPPTGCPSPAPNARHSS